MRSWSAGRGLSRGAQTKPAGPAGPVVAGAAASTPSRLDEPELEQHREDAELVDQHGGIEDIDAVGIVGILLDDQVGGELLRLLDEPLGLELAVLRDQVGTNDVRRDDVRIGKQARAVGSLLLAAIGPLDDGTQLAEDIGREEQRLDLEIAVVRVAWAFVT